MATFLEVFNECFAHRLGARAHTFRVLFERMTDLKRNLTIVETGCLRVPGNWEGDGQSTLMLDQFADSTHSTFYSVDLSEKSIQSAQSVVGKRCFLVQADSVKFLSQFNAQIDVLYLDSYDYDRNNPFPSAKHHLMELCAAQRRLHKGSLVVVDDTWRSNQVIQGKGVLVAEYMRNVDATLLAHGYQDVWELTR